MVPELSDVEVLNITEGLLLLIQLFQTQVAPPQHLGGMGTWLETHISHQRRKKQSDKVTQTDTELNTEPHDDKQLLIRQVHHSENDMFLLKYS